MYRPDPKAVKQVEMFSFNVISEVLQANLFMPSAVGIKTSLSLYYRRISCMLLLPSAITVEKVKEEAKKQRESDGEASIYTRVVVFC